MFRLPAVVLVFLFFSLMKEALCESERKNDTFLHATRMDLQQRLLRALVRYCLHVLHTYYKLFVLISNFVITIERDLILRLFVKRIMQVWLQNVMFAIGNLCKGLRSPPEVGMF